MYENARNKNSHLRDKQTHNNIQKSLVPVDKNLNESTNSKLSIGGISIIGKPARNFVGFKPNASISGSDTHQPQSVTSS